MKLLYKVSIGVAFGVVVFASGLAVATAGATNSATDSYTPSSYTYTKPFTIKSSDGLRDLDVNLETFRDALKSYGATKNNPMSIDYITAYSSLGPLNTSMYNQIATEINTTLSDGLMDFSYLLATNANPSNTTWFTTGNSEMGFFLWGPDYDGVGTWISAWIGMDEDGNNTKNSFNAWKLIHDRMRNVLVNEDEYVAIYGQDYYDAAKSLLEDLVSYGIYNNYSADNPTQIPEDYKQAFKNIGTADSGSLKTDYFISQILGGTEGLNITNFLINILDNAYLYIPQPTIGLNYREPTLYDPQFIVRTSPFAGSQLRDFTLKDKSEFTQMSGSEYGTYKGITSSDFFASSSGQIFNQSFGTASPTLIPNDVGQVSLVGIETTGNWSNDNPDAEPVDHLRLNGATALNLYDSNNNLLLTINRNQDINLNDTATANALEKAVKYEFTVDQKMAWVDKNGVSKQTLSGKDFERGFESFWLASEMNLQANSYFIDSMNLDMQKTVNQNNSETITSSNYNINNFTNTDDTFTVYVTEPNLYLLQYLTKGYFWAMPYTNSEVQNIRVGSGTITLNSNGTYTIDYSKIYGNGTNANDIFGDDNFWSAAPYYLSNMTNSEITLTYNNYYFNARKDDLLNKDNKVKKYILREIPGINAANLFEQFKNGNVSSASIPSDQTTDVLNDSSMQDKILYIGSSKTSQSNYAIWNGNPYDENGNLKSTVNAMAAQFLDDFESDNARIIRAGINGFLNMYNISQIVYTAGDFDYSSIPYGVYTWTETVDGTEVQQEYWKELYDGTYAPYLLPNYGGLPRAVSEYIEAGLGV